MNTCNFAGRMTRDAEDVGNPPTGCKFSLAVEGYNPSTKSRETTFVPMVAFGKVVDVIKNYAGKGKYVLVTAEYRTREYEVQGQKRKDHNFVVRDFELGPGQANAPQQQDPVDAGDGW